MDWTPLASSNLSAMRYDEQSRTLQIRFQSGRSYDYQDVPADVADGLKQADSPGRYFLNSIKGVYAES
jgi:hypothetical protein